MPGYFHGGSPGLKPGDLLLPPAETGARTTAAWFKQAVEEGRLKGPGIAALDTTNVYREDRVYVTTVLEQAVGFAQHWIPADAVPGDDLGAGGAVYRVVPHRCAWERDPDNMDVAQTWWCCERALVVEVLVARVRRQTREEFAIAYAAEMRRMGLRLSTEQKRPAMAVPRTRKTRR